MRSSAATASRMNIGEVRAHLNGDFPGISIAKIRYLESEGLVDPERTPSGYRKYSYADLERLRYVLTAQRDHYLPLKVIKEHLDAIDRGLEPPPLVDVGPKVPDVDAGGTSSVVPGEGEHLRLSRGELVEAAQITDAQLGELETYGLVQRRVGAGASAAPYDGDALAVATAAGELAAFGLEPRHLRAFRTAADRQVGLVEQVVTPLRRGRDEGAQGRAEEAVAQLGAISVRLHQALVRVGLRSLR